MPRATPSQMCSTVLIAVLAGCAGGGPDPSGGQDASSDFEAWIDIADRGDGGGTDLAGPPPVDPPVVPSFGHLRVAVDTAAAGVTPTDVTGVRVGAIPALLPELTADDRVSVLVQGSPSPGPAEVFLETEDDDVSFGAVLSFEAPQHPAFERIGAFGASHSQGVQRGVPGFHGALMSPPAQVARQIGAHFPLPLLIPGLFPELGPDDIGPPPSCAVPNVVDFVTVQAGEVIPLLQDPETGDFTYAAARLDPHRPVANMAVGGSSLRMVLDGPDPGDLGGNFVSHLVYDPFGPFLGPVDASQLAHLEALSPTLVLCADLFGNDVILAIAKGEGIDLANATPEDVLVADIAEAVDRLAATGAEVFLTNLPDPSLLPVTEEKRRAMEAAGTPDIDETIAAIVALGAAGNAALDAAAAQHPNVHVADLFGATEAIRDAGIVLAGQLFEVRKFGGLLGVDGIHFSDTGYGFVANVLIDRINQVLNADIPRVDLDAIAATDPEGPDALRAAGLDIDACAH